MNRPEPAHPSVNWEIKDRRADGWRVQVTCPACGKPRFEPARTVRYRVRSGRYTGLCRDDWRTRPVTRSGDPNANPPHPAVNWEKQRQGPTGMQVQVTCPVCMEVRCELAKAVRYRITQGRFTGRCRLHGHVASRSPAVSEGSELDHPAVDWHSRERRDGEYWVRVTCPVCGQTRYEIAKSVRYRVRRGRYTGMCRADAQRARVAASRQGDSEGATSGLVEVTCPVCQKVRMISAASVRRQKRLGIFTGRCTKDRLVGATRGEYRERPAHPSVDWQDREVVMEAGNPPRRRSMVRVHCPQCNAIRLLHPAALERSLLTGTFRPECPLHRRNPLRIQPQPDTRLDTTFRAG